MRAMCKPTGLRSPGCLGRLEPARHLCEEVKGQLREKVRIDLIMVGQC